MPHNRMCHIMSSARKQSPLGRVGLTRERRKSSKIAVSRNARITKSRRAERHTMMGRFGETGPIS
jgi:hypothetical protein